jgi:rhodanese-related sulfurtransferase
MARLGLLILFLAIFTAGETMADSGMKEVGTGDVSRLQSEGALVIDVRRPDEWRKTGIVPNSRLLTAFDETGRFQPEFLETVLKETNPDDSLVLICLSGARSDAVGRFLSTTHGYSKVYNVLGGMADWMQQGYAVDPCPTC